MSNHSCSAAIDVVVLWVNGSDINFQHLFNFTLQSTKNSLLYPRHSIESSRFREFDQLKYLLRSIEEHGSAWARRIFLVTNKQVPNYLKINHPRIRMVDHEQLFKYTNMTPPKYPLFNSLAIQSMLHNIPTLSSPFYLFDDDFLVRKHLPVSMIINGNRSIVDLNPEMFNIHGAPKTVYQHHVKSTVNMVERINSFALLQSNGKYMVGYHGPILLYREIGNKIWDKFPEKMNLLISHPFRMPTDPLIQVLYVYMGYSDYYIFVKDRKFWGFEMLQGRHPRLISKALERAFTDRNAYVLCINDDLLSFNDWMQKHIKFTYETIFPRISSFENQF